MMVAMTEMEMVVVLCDQYDIEIENIGMTMKRSVPVLLSDGLSHLTLILRIDDG